MSLHIPVGEASSNAPVRRRSRTAQASTIKNDEKPAKTRKAVNGEVQDTFRSKDSRLPVPAIAVLFLSLCLLLLFWHYSSELKGLGFFPVLLKAYDLTFKNIDEPIGGPKRLDILLSPQNHTTRQKAALDLEWVITSGYRRPDGVLKRVYLVNNQFPGPTVEARSGDTLRVLVKNNLDDGEDIALHWHGLHMAHANDMDGAVGFTQCPIRPGRSFTYHFQISPEQHGTFWYHAHDQVQRADGLFGGLIVHTPADEAERPQLYAPAPEYEEERLLLIGDWYHSPATDVMKWYMRAGSFGNEPVPDSLIVNDGGAYNCADAVKARPVDCRQVSSDNLPLMNLTRNKAYRFRIVNTGTLAGFTLHLPGASVLPFEVDGGNPIDNNGTLESLGVLYPGERVDFIATWPDSLHFGTSTLEIELDAENFRYPNPALTTSHRFPISLSSSSFSTINPPSSLPVPSRPPPAFTLSRAVTPLRAALNTALPQEANTTVLLYATTKKLARLSNVPYGFMNHTTWKPSTPPLLLSPRARWDKHQLVPYIRSPRAARTWVDVVLNNLDDGSHPFHLHGHFFHILSIHAGGPAAVGKSSPGPGNDYWGSYNPFDWPPGEPPPGGPYNTRNPPRRDTVHVPARGYAVVRFRAANDGLWMFHCHILWHQASGMAMGFHVGAGEEEEDEEGGGAAVPRGTPMEVLRLADAAQLRETCAGYGDGGR